MKGRGSDKRTCWDFDVRLEIPVDVHRKIHHVGVAKQVQLSLQQFLLIVDLH